MCSRGRSFRSGPGSRRTAVEPSPDRQRCGNASLHFAERDPSPRETALVRTLARSEAIPGPSDRLDQGCQPG